MKKMRSGAWYWLEAGSPFTNSEIFDWAVRPLEGERISLAGDAYNPQRAAWIDAAFRSSNHLLNTNFGMNLKF